MKTIVTFIIFLGCTTLFGQSGIENRELVVEKEYSNEIYEVNPIFEYASIYTPQNNAINFGKDSLIRTSAFTPDLNVFIRPLAYNTPAVMTGHKGFVKLDKGTLNPIHAQGGYSYSAQNYFNVNASFNFDNRNDNRSSNMNIKNIGGNVGMEYYLTNSIKTEIDLQYSKNQYGLYGSNKFTSGLETENTTGRSIFGATLGLKTFKTSPSKWNFNLSSKFSQWSNYHSEDTEQNIDLIGGVQFKFNKTWGISLAPNYRTSSSSTMNTNNVLSGSLMISHNASNFYSKLGIVANVFDEHTSLWPKSDIRWQLSKEAALNLRSDAEGVILGAQAITLVNPYSNINQLVNAEKFISLQRNIHLNIKTRLAGDVDFSFKLGYLNAQDDLNFVSSTSDIRTFEFERVDYQVMSLAFDVSKEILGPSLKTGIMVQYNNYANYDTPLFNRPTVVVTPSIGGSLFNGKLSYNIAALINNPQQLDRIPYIVTQSEWRKNISGSITYSVIDQLNINVNMDNILDDDYQVWKGYNNFGRNISGGILFKF